jgi:hypothetical protein
VLKPADHEVKRCQFFNISDATDSETFERIRRRNGCAVPGQIAGDAPRDNLRSSIRCRGKPKAPSERVGLFEITCDGLLIPEECKSLELIF